jgi:hypothetical protein
MGLEHYAMSQQKPASGWKIILCEIEDGRTSFEIN